MLISFILGIFCIRFLRSYDIHEKEPFIKMFLAMAIGGAVSVFTAFLFYKGIYAAGIHQIKNSVGALFIIGPIEEAAKFMGFAACLPFIRKEMNEPVDGLVYIACVALGFSLIENYSYSTHDTESAPLLFMRLFISTPAHICFSLPMGLPIYLIVNKQKGGLLLLEGFFIATLLHGVFDLILFNAWIIAVFILFIKLMYHRTWKLLGYVTALSPYRCSLERFVQTYPNPAEESGIECIHCGNSSPKFTYRLGKIMIQKCPECGHFVATRDSLYYIFHHFASSFENLSSNYYAKKTKTADYTLFGDNFISNSKKIAYFDLKKLSARLEKMNLDFIAEAKKRGWQSASD